MPAETSHKTAQIARLETPASSAPVGDAGPYPVVTPPATGRSGPAEQPNSAVAVESGPGTAGSTITAGPVLTFIAHGNPVGQGNIRHLGKGRPAIHQNAKTLLPWRDTIRAAAIAAIGTRSGYPLDAPVAVQLTFTVPKPTGAPKTRRVWPAKRPDLDHMIRAALDAITHVVFVDDARVVEMHAAKRYPLEGLDALHFPGVVVRIYLVDDTGEEGSR